MKKFEGLENQEARERLIRNGPNEIFPSQFHTKLEEIKKILFDPMGVMLLVLALLHALVGNERDALILLLAFIPVVMIDVFLQIRVQRVLKAMRSALKPIAKVIREGIVIDIPAREVVEGDLLVFEEGQTLSADGEIVEASNLSINESALTGESVPIEKNVGQFFFAGTSITNGRGLGQVGTTGVKTQFGRIARLLNETEVTQSPLQRKVNKIIQKILWVAIALAVLLFAIKLWRGSSLYESLIVAFTFGMSAIPEEFPLVFTIYLSFGAWRLSKHGVLIRSLPSVESLGGVNVICTDKTGTLTEGQFQLEQFFSFSPNISESKIWQLAMFSCEVNPVDSMEVEISKRAKRYAPQMKGWHLKFDHLFENIGKHMSHVWQNEETGSSILVMKGAVEGILDHCLLGEGEKKFISEKADAFASKGYRILGMAYREGKFSGQREMDEKGLKFLGLFLFTDPVRPSAKEAIEICQREGIEIKMLTGDHPLTAHAVAEKTGIVHEHEFLFTGQCLSLMSLEEKEQAYQRGAIFSRVRPEQKYEMVEALKKMGKVVAMTGDGINDAPALKLADVGISMGLDATDVARSTAQIILVKNDFRGLVEAVFEGRRIFSNLRKSFSYLVAFHVPVVLLALIPPLFNWGDLLLPIHIIFLELLVHPISAFVFESLPLPPGRVEKSLLPFNRLISALFSGSVLSVLALIIFWKLHSIKGEDVARTYALAAVYLGNMYFVLQSCDFKLSRRLLMTEALLIFFALFVVFVPLASNILYLKL